jgi:hypothetical protein
MLCVSSLEVMEMGLGPLSVDLRIYAEDPVNRFFDLVCLAICVGR